MKYLSKRHHWHHVRRNPARQPEGGKYPAPIRGRSRLSVKRRSAITPCATRMCDGEAQATKLSLATHRTASAAVGTRTQLGFSRRSRRWRREQQSKVPKFAIDSL